MRESPQQSTSSRTRLSILVMRKCSSTGVDGIALSANASAIDARRIFRCLGVAIRGHWPLHILGSIDLLQSARLASDAVPYSASSSTRCASQAQAFSRSVTTPLSREEAIDATLWHVRRPIFTIPPPKHARSLSHKSHSQFQRSVGLPSGLWCFRFPHAVHPILRSAGSSASSDIAKPLVELSTTYDKCRP